MDTKLCANCGFEKPYIDFRVKNSNKDGLELLCSICLNERNQKLYAKNKEQRHKNIYARKKKRSILIREFILQIKRTRGCGFCNINNPTCLDFHHIDSLDKVFNLSQASQGFSKERIEEEVEKCVIICGNCHRKLHAGKLDGSNLKPIVLVDGEFIKNIDS
jgi:hypothetical protein